MIKYRAWWHVGYQKWAVSLDYHRRRGQPIFMRETLGEALDTISKIVREGQARVDSSYHQH